MATTREQFVENLVRSGLMTGADLRQFEQGLARGKRLEETEALAKELVRAGKLTKYQAQMVYQGKVKGLVLGENVVLDKIGQGGMGVVLKAQHRRMKRIVAIKVLPASAMKSPEAVKRFYHEVEAAAKLSHPNIVAAYDASESDGIHYLVMEYVDGKDLAAIMDEQGPLGVRRAVECVLQTAKGLAYAHRQGVVHRDIKPANLLVDQEGNVKILDMGLARVARTAGAEDPNSERLTRSSQVMGTYDYMAPEQAEATRNADHRSDIYSLGCTLYRLLTHQSPYDGESLVQLVIAHQSAPIPSLRAARPEVPESVDAVFRKMVAKRPEDRYQSMAEVIVDLEACLGELRAATMGDEPVGWGASPSPPTRGKTGAAPQATVLKSLGQAFPGGTAVAATRQDTAGVAETLTREAAAETRDGLGLRERLLVVARKKRMLTAAIGVGLLGIAGLVVFLAITIRIRHPDGTETSVTVPDGSQVTVSPQGDVDVTLKGESGKPKAESGRPKAESGKPKVESGPQTSTSPISNAKSQISNPPSPVPRPPSPAVAPFDAAKAKQHQEAWAKYVGAPVEVTNSIGMKLVFVPPGEFDMGSTPEESAWAAEQATDKAGTKFWTRITEPRHHVKLTRPFYIGKYPVTQAEYEKVMGVNPSDFSAQQIEVTTFHQTLPVMEEDEKRYRKTDAKRVAGKDTRRYPVETVAWDDCVEFCRLLSETPAERAAGRVYRLPTEAQWEYACRAGTTTRWNFGDNPADLGQYAWFQENSGWQTHPVGEKKPNAWTLYDMHGLVSEWCADRFDGDYYKVSPLLDPPGPSAGVDRVLRAASFASNAGTLRSAWRRFDPRNSRSRGFGFRVVVEMVAESGKPRAVGPAPPANAGTAPGAAGKAAPTSSAADSGPPSPSVPPPAAVAPFDAAKAKQHQEAWAKYLGAPVVKTNSIGMTLVLIPPGEFLMGSTPEEIAWALENGNKERWYIGTVNSEAPRHRVRITKPFYLGTCQVTQAEYAKVMGVNPSAFSPKPVDASAFKPPLPEPEIPTRREDAKRAANRDTSRHPVETVSWDDSVAFCRGLSALPAERAARHVYRLPTEAEWEHACRAGTTTRWYCGDDEAGLFECASFAANSFTPNVGMATHPVGEKKPNAWGLYDMHGNVFQWCSDWGAFDEYRQSPLEDPTGPPSGWAGHVMRGGAWIMTASFCRSAFRLPQGPSTRSHNIGFRVVAGLPVGPSGAAAPGAEPPPPPASGPKTTSPAPRPPSPVSRPPSPAVAPFDAATALAHQANRAKYLGVPVVETNSVGMKLALIPPGEFDMGSTPEESAWVLAQPTAKEGTKYWTGVAEPRHHVNLTRPFYMGRYVVTQDEYGKVTGVNPSSFTADPIEISTFHRESPGEEEKERQYREADGRHAAGKDTRQYPVETVAWDDGVEFCRLLSETPSERAAGRVYRLPTEAEWEYACRAGTTTRWNFGDHPADLGQYAWFQENSDWQTHPVGQKKPNAWMLYDMHGLVWEWCMDRFGNYKDPPLIDPTGSPVDINRVLRGGNFAGPAIAVRSAWRSHAGRNSRTRSVGFRVVLVVGGQEQPVGPAVPAKMGTTPAAAGKASPTNLHTVTF